MTAKRSPHHAAVERARVLRQAEAHRRRQKIAAELRYWEIYTETLGLRYPSAALIDPPKTEEEKTARWARIWGRR